MHGNSEILIQRYLEAYTGFPRYLREMGTEKNMLEYNKFAYKKIGIFFTYSWFLDGIGQNIMN